MNSEIQRVVPKEDWDRVKKVLESDNFLLDILEKVCYNIIRDNSKITKKDYDSAGWAYEQAHRNGVVETADRLLTIINRNKKET